MTKSQSRSFTASLTSLVLLLVGLAIHFGGERGGHPVQAQEATPSGPASIQIEQPAADPSAAPTGDETSATAEL